MKLKPYPLTILFLLLSGCLCRSTSAADGDAADTFRNSSAVPGETLPIATDTLWTRQHVIVHRHDGCAGSFTFE